MVTEALSQTNTDSTRSRSCPAQIYKLLRKIKVLRLKNPRTKPCKNTAR